MINPRQGYLFSWNSKATRWSQEGDNARIGATFRTWLGDRLATNGQSLTLLDMRAFDGKIFNAIGADDRNQAAPDLFATYFRAAIETRERKSRRLNSSDSDATRIPHYDTQKKNYTKKIKK